MSYGSSGFCGTYASSAARRDRDRNDNETPSTSTSPL
jgi:hypothetical protein